MSASRIKPLLLACLSFSTLAGVLAGPAHADKSAARAANPDHVDVSAYRSSMVVLHDGKGHYIIASPIADHYDELFYGDGKVFHQQRVFGGSMNASEPSMSATFWDPRVNSRTAVQQRKGAWSVSCGERETALEVLEPAKAKTLLETAEFRKAPWKYQAHKLARDDRGVYYYVDRLRDDRGGKGHRLWVGPRGNMKLTKLTNIVSDSVGEIYATKTGELRMVTAPYSVTWIRGKKRSELTSVPVEDNVVLIYAELGVYYGDLGTPCDDF